MNYIFLLKENIINGFNIVTLDIITVIAILCGVFVIVSKNPIVSVLFLIGLFLSISVYLMLLGFNFIGLSYLLVYVGAVSILFLFILMLINIRISEIITTTSNSIPLGIIIGSLFFSAIYSALPKSNLNLNDKHVKLTLDNTEFSSNSLPTSVKNTMNEYVSSFYNMYDNGNVSNIYNFTRNAEQELHLTYSHNWDSMLAEVSHINTIGNILYTSFAL